MARQKKMLGTAVAIASLAASLIGQGASLATQANQAKRQERLNNYNNNLDYNNQINQNMVNSGLSDDALNSLNSKINPLGIYRCGGRKAKRNGGQQFFDRLTATKYINKNRF